MYLFDKSFCRECKKTGLPFNKEVVLSNLPILLLVPAQSKIAKFLPLFDKLSFTMTNYIRLLKGALIYYFEFVLFITSLLFFEVTTTESPS